jgi:ABC-type transport system involved in cytochrome bd biosynthesis fused ATPase/permease subunit
MQADHIMVLEQGRILGYGTHRELLAGCELYREISESQMGQPQAPRQAGKTADGVTPGGLVRV